MGQVIWFRNVVKRFGAVDALNKLDFSLEEGEAVALVGNNGCGKTTTVNVLANLIPYDSGEVFAFNKQVTPNYVSYKNRLGVLLSPPVLISEFTVLDYLRFVCKFQKVAPNFIENRIKDLINSFEIELEKRKKIGDYSSGNKMKICLAATIIHNPEVLILDEPFNHLDLKTTSFLVELLSSMKNKKTLFITSPNLDLILDLCDRIMIMHEGRILKNFNKVEYPSIESLKESISNLTVERKDHARIPNWLGESHTSI